MSGRIAKLAALVGAGASVVAVVGVPGAGAQSSQPVVGGPGAAAQSSEPLCTGQFRATEDPPEQPDLRLKFHCRVSVTSFSIHTSLPIEAPGVALAALEFPCQGRKHGHSYSCTFAHALLKRDRTVKPGHGIETDVAVNADHATSYVVGLTLRVDRHSFGYSAKIRIIDDLRRP